MAWIPLALRLWWAGRQRRKQPPASSVRPPARLLVLGAEQPELRRRLEAMGYVLLWKAACACNRWGWPDREILAEVEAFAPDTLLDLQPEPEACMLLLSLLAPVTLRMGLYHPRREPYFDILYRTEHPERMDWVVNWLQAMEKGALC